jgi:hydrogenase nickel incorporation protein HypA/HybF
MHEMSLAGGILKLVEDAARRERFARVTQLRLEAGRFAGVEVRALRFAIDAMSPGTCLEGAALEIHEPAGTAWCLQCNGSVLIHGRADPCPQCGSFRWHATGGTELRVVDMRVTD